LPANTAAVALQTASATKFNALMSDISDTLTDSVSRTGKGGMQAQFKAIDGTVSNPGITFGGQLSTGMRRIDDNSAALVQAGVDSLIFTDEAVQAPDGSVGTTDLVSNGNFSSFTGWSGTNWAQSANKALHTAGSTSSLVETITLVAPTKYLVTYTVSGRTVGDVTAEFQGTSTVSGTNRSTNGTFQDILTAVTGNTAIAITPSSDFDGSIDNVSCLAAAIPGISFQGDDTSGLRSRSGGIGLVVGNIDIGTITSSGINLDSGKAVTLNGSALGVGTETVNLLAAGMIPRVSGGTPTATTAERGASNPKTFSGYSFVNGSNQGLHLMFPMPKSWNGGTLTLSFWVEVPGAGAGDMVWRARAVCLANGDDFDATAWGSYVQVVKTRVASTVVMQTGTVTITPGGTPAGQNLLIVEIERRASNAADTLAQPAVLIAAPMTYTVTSLTDD
jgi:hypothetical protein